MSELLDAFDDAGLLDVDTRTFLVEALVEAEASEWRNILEPFLTPTEPALKVLEDVPNVLQRSLRALAEALVAPPEQAPETADKDGATVLCIAAKNGHVACIEALLGQGADMEAADEHGATALNIAAKSGHVACIEALLGHRANVEATDNNGATGLYVAASLGQVACVDALIGHGANVEAADEHGTTALQRATEQGHVPIVEALLRGRSAGKWANRQLARTLRKWAKANGHKYIIDLVDKAERAAQEKAWRSDPDWGTWRM